MGVYIPTNEGITQLTGDGTAGPGLGSQALTLATVATPGTVGDATHYPIVTVDAKGRLTGATPQAVPAGVSPATTVTGPDAYGAASVVGVGTLFARNDHNHGLPAAPSLTYVFGNGTATPAQATPTTIVTLTLTVGTWLVLVTGSIDLGTGASDTELGFFMIGYGGTASFTNIGYNNLSFTPGVASTGPAQGTPANMVISTVTVAGTYTIVVDANNGTLGTGPSALANAFALKIA